MFITNSIHRISRVNFSNKITHFKRTISIPIISFSAKLNTLSSVNNISTVNNISSLNSLTTVHNRDSYLSPVFKTFNAYDDPLVIEKGYMQYIWDIEGNKYIDMSAQNICVSVGHSHPYLVRKISEQIRKLPHCSSMYYNSKSALLAKKLVETLPPHPSGDDWVVHLVNSGSDAVDLAIQMSREYTNNHEIYGLYKAYHGLLGYAAGITSIGKSNQSCYSKMYSGIKHVESNNIDQLEMSLKYSTAGSVSGIIIEPQQGYGGVFPLEKDYMKNAFELIQKYNGVTIADEVQTGYGRCGESFWAFQMKHNNVIPDIITTAKGMGNGMGIIGAVICRRSIAEAFTHKMFFNTYGANPISSTAALGVLEVIEKENIIQNCSLMGNILYNKINKLCDDYPNIFKEIRGAGLFLGLEVYGKTLEESINKTKIIHKLLLKNGIVISKGSAMGNVLRIQPPMCIEEADVNYFIYNLEKIAKNLK